VTGRAADLGCNGLRQEAAATGRVTDLGGDRERLRRGVTATGRAADLGGDGEWWLQ
jgi:hypothetical protein